MVGAISAIARTTSTLKFDENGEPLHIQQAAQIRAFRAAWKEAGHARTPRISVSRSIFALLDDRDRAYFGRGSQEEDSIGFLDESTRGIFGRSYAAEPDILIEHLRKDDAIAEANPYKRSRGLTRPGKLGRARLEISAQFLGFGSQFPLRSSSRKLTSPLFKSGD
jgi:hypothetical protein